MDLSKVRGKWADVQAILPELMGAYEADIQAADQRLSITGKTGPEAQKEQCGWPVYYGVKRAEINKLLKYLDSRQEQIRAKFWKHFSEGYSRQLGERVIDKYINGEEEYMRFRELYLEVEELKEKFDAVCNAFDKRGFTLRDWTTLKVNQLQNDII